MRTYIDWEDVAAAAEDLAGNHKKFDSFAWFARPEDGENWALVYTHNRDSDLLDQSNADAISKELEKFTEDDNPDVVAERHSHWACGWIDGYAIRVYGANGEITEAFQAYANLQARMADYPLLDEEDHSRREYEASMEAVESEGRRFVRDDSPEDWVHQVWSWLWENNQRELENRDGTGGYPSTESVKEALGELGFLEDDA